MGLAIHELALSRATSVAARDSTGAPYSQPKVALDGLQLPMACGARLHSSSRLHSSAVYCAMSFMPFKGFILTAVDAGLPGNTVVFPVKVHLPT